MDIIPFKLNKRIKPRVETLAVNQCSVFIALVSVLLRYCIVFSCTCTEVHSTTPDEPGRDGKVEGEYPGKVIFQNLYLAIYMSIAQSRLLNSAFTVLVSLYNFCNFVSTNYYGKHSRYILSPISSRTG